MVTFEPLRTDHTCTRESAPPDSTYRPSGVQHASKSSASRPPPPRFPPLPPVSVATSMRLTSSNGAKALWMYIAPPATHIRSFPSSENLAHVTLGLFPVEGSTAPFTPPIAMVLKGPLSYPRASYNFTSPSSVAAAKIKPCASYATAGVVAHRTTPLHWFVRKSHSRIVWSAAALRNWSVFADIDTDTTCFVCPTKYRRYVLSCSEWYRSA